MSIKARLILFLILVMFATPFLYFMGIYINFHRLPLDISLNEHIDALNSVINKQADPRLTLVVILSLLMPLLAFAPSKGPKGEHGSASFAKKSLIKKMNLLKKQGVVLGKFGRDLLKYSEKLATLVLAPPGTGKTAGIAIPNLLTFNSSAIVLDVKGELYNKTHEQRKKFFGSKIYKFNPADENSMRFNPFDKTILKDLNWNEKEEIVDQVAYLIYQDKENFDHWITEGRNVFTMFSLYLIYKNGYSSIPDIRELMISNFSLMFSEEFQFDTELEAFLYFIRENIANDEELPLRIREDAVSLLRKEERELGSVISSCKSALNVFSSSTVREAFRTNDLVIEKFRTEVSTLYISIQEKDLKRFEMILRLFIEFNLRKILSKEPKKDELDILGLYDEFPRFGKIDYLVDSPELGRSYKLITILIAQDYGQIEEVYGKSKVSRINTSTAYKVIFPQANQETAEMTSKYIGDFTSSTVSESKSLGDKGNTNKSYSTQLSGQALLSKQDILNMNDGQIYILAKNFYKHPIKAKPYLYFEDRKLKKLVK